MLKLLIILSIVMLVIVAVQAMKISELLADLRGTQDDAAKPTRYDNNLNAILVMIFLFGELFFMGWQLIDYQKFLLPQSASEHGVGVDQLLNINFLVIGLVFLLTQVLLFWYAFKYKASNTRKATFYPDNHKLETIWTVVPAVVLVALIVYGLKTWNDIVEPADKSALKIELYAKQFDWTARYPGKDNKLGYSYYKNIADDNVLGLDKEDKTGGDDIIVKELHMPVGRDIDFTFHSRDVIHSAYMPHFRAQMNCVPGMDTKFHFKPTITTEQMRDITKNPAFDYVVLCNKICGVAHFNMKMKIVVETEEQFNEWLKKQKTFAETLAPAAVPADSTAHTAPATGGTATTTMTIN